MAKKLVRFMNTAFRDGFQSVYGARVFTDDFMPAVEAATAAGCNYFEAGGGARFQSLYFYSNECAFDMMDRFRATAGPDADLQTLARGINVVALDSQPKDVIKLHAEMFKKHGISSIRNFDALNDVNNLIYSGQCIAEAGLKHQVVISMMALPPGCTGAHDADFYVNMLKQIMDADIPYHSICFKDASGTSFPATVYETIKRAKEIIPADIPVQFHTHDTAGIGVIGYKAAIEAGVDVIDLSMAPCSGGTCQPDIMTMWHALRGTDYELDVDIDKIREAEEVFKECMKDYFLPPEAKAVEPIIPWSPMPGGALTANSQMMRDNNIMDRFPEVIGAMDEVVRRGGFGTSVTPVSQFYFQQAFNNVMMGKWNKVAEGYGKMVLGYFGKTPVAPDPEIIKIASEQLGLEPTTRSPLDINEEDPTKGLGCAQKKLEESGLPVTDENLFITASCGDKGINYLLGKATLGVRKNVPEAAKAETKAAPEGYTVTVGGSTYTVKLDGDTAVVNGKAYNVNVAEGLAAAPAAVTTTPGAIEAVKAQMPGAVVRILVAKGTKVNAGDTLLVQEAMKMEVEVKAPMGGTVVELLVATGDQVNADQLLIQIQTEGAPGVVVAAPAAPTGPGEEVTAQMPGAVIKVLVDNGSAVKAGDTLLVQEAMKMEVEVKAPVDGTVTCVSVSAGDQVASGQSLVTIA
ncbi:biotin/lipoyl-containing protein [Desulfoluna sp.]|uniref:biotin/lipoyl-containing protein n=1 Tax=Desulfoluna sp. TaxID=2045199 RepID=UPI00260DD0DD|nr:biotin/lipoyl-containing protein [Desulfoluna sp.]